MKVVRASAVQISPVLYSREGTVEKVVAKIHELGKQGVQFATFPETVVPYYPYFSVVQTGSQIIASGEFLKLLDQAVTVPSLTTEAIGDACRQMFQTNLIMPEPCPFINTNLPACSVIRPTKTTGAATGAVKFLTAMGLFNGQPQVFFTLLSNLAAAADAAMREV